MTPVIFKKEGRDIVAFFPSMPGTCDAFTCGCYAHIGQHGAANVLYASRLKPAKVHEFGDLLRELVAIGYDDLKIVSRFTRHNLEARRAELNRIIA